MNYKKLMTGTFVQRSDNKTQLAFALIAGLAAGAAVAVLFAAKSGKDVRRRITDKAMGLAQGAKDIYGSLISKINCRSGKSGERIRNGAEGDQGNHDGNHAVAKKPKSDIRKLVQEARGAAHTEQGL